MSKKYEYTIELSPGSQYLERMLNKTGQQGWRVVAIDLKVSDDQTLILLEREIEQRRERGPGL